MLDGNKAGNVCDTKCCMRESKINGEEIGLDRQVEEIPPLQSEINKPVFIGADAIALYPSLDEIATA